MSYVKTIVCLANSFKIGGRCIAGKEILPNGTIGGWVRPVSDRPGAEIQESECRYSGSGSPHLLDLIEIHFLRPEPRGHQTENHRVDPHYTWRKMGHFPLESLLDLLDAPPRLWRDTDSTTSGVFDCISAVEAAMQSYSLAFIRPNEPRVEIGPGRSKGRKRYMVEFGYGASEYRLKLTDPALLMRLEKMADGGYPLPASFLSVSLTEPFERDNRCHKLVAAYIPQPSRLS